MNYPVAHGSSGFAITHRSVSASQSKKASMTEAVVNTLVGYAIALGGQIVIFPMFGMHASLTANLEIGGIFMLISTARSYVIRRVMEQLRLRGIVR